MNEVGERGGHCDAEDEDGGGSGAGARGSGVCGGGEAPDSGGTEGEEVGGVEGDADDEGLEDPAGDIDVVGPAAADGGPDGDPDDAR